MRHDEKRRNLTHRPCIEEAKPPPSVFFFLLINNIFYIFASLVRIIRI